jgi:HEAT repeat protein
MLKADEEVEVVQAVLIALSQQHDGKAIPLAIRFASHSDSMVRYAVVLVLTGHEHPAAIDALVLLSADDDPHVRDWATFGLGTQIDLDTRMIRDALAARLDDPDRDTRAEAQIGLARRKDRRLVPALLEELRSDRFGSLSIEAAELIATKELLSPLVALRDWWDIDTALLERAIAASS